MPTAIYAAIPGRCSSLTLQSLERHLPFISSWALEQKFVRIELSIFAHLAGYDRLGFVAK